METKRDKIIFSISMSKENILKLKELAKKENRTVSNYIETKLFYNGK